MAVRENFITVILFIRPTQWKLSPYVTVHFISLFNVLEMKDLMGLPVRLAGCFFREFAKLLSSQVKHQFPQ